MITEDYVSFETAKLLKEKGFDIAVNAWYGEYTSPFSGDKYNVICFDRDVGYEFIAYAPTLQMAMKWLREVHHFHIIPEISDGLRLNPQYYVVIWLTTSKSESYILDLFDSYEEACEAAIKYCLENLI